VVVAAQTSLLLLFLVALEVADLIVVHLQLPALAPLIKDLQVQTA
jgi:hypothetical protein